MAQAILKQYQLQSPIQGKVIEHFKDIGEWVRSGDPLVRVMDTSTCYVEVDVEIHELANTPLGRSVDLLIPSPKGQQNITGTVTFVSPSADRGSGLVRVKVIFDNSQAKVIPGVTAVVQLPK
jgi:multidrug efflux pump subunit AcrA (membrane-fusion protein)